MIESSIVPVDLQRVEVGILSCEVLMGKVPKAFLINYQVLKSKLIFAI